MPAPAPLWDRLVAEAGPGQRLRFDQFMEIVLYDPDHGYYARRPDRAGRNGDFLTSVELSPLFGACVAHWLHEVYRQSGSGPFHLVELGAGRGTLARTILGALPQDAFRSDLRLHLVERSASARESQDGLAHPHVHRYASLEEVPARLGRGAVLANELFDNLPVRRVMRARGWKEIVLRVGGRALREELVDAPPDLRSLIEAHGVRLAEGQCAEVSPEAGPTLRRALSRLEAGGLLLIDYGDEAPRLYGDTFPQGTLATHRAHVAAHDYYGALGEQDLTAHVNFTVLRRVAEDLGFVVRLETQTEFLARNGLPELVARALETEQNEWAKIRITQWARILYHPEAMGERFRALVGVRAPALAGAHRNPGHQ